MKILTWNIQWCRGVDGRVDPDRIVDTALAIDDLDVICLQEVCVNYPRLLGAPAHDQPAILRSRLPGWHVAYGAALDEWTADGGQQFGNLVATRLPVLRVEHHRLPYPADGAALSMPRQCTSVMVEDPGLGPVRVMTTHLEYHSSRQRHAQAQALARLHREACEQARQPPRAGPEGSPFRARVHTAHAVLCGDFNFTRADDGYALITQHTGDGDALHDAWTLRHGARPQPPTFCLHDKTYGSEPIACDFVFVSHSLRSAVRAVAVDGQTQASDHQPVWVELG